MRATTVIRSAMIGVVVIVVVAVVVSWRGRPDDITATENEVPDAAPDVVSRTRSPRYVSVVNGVTRYEVSAGRALSFEGRRSVYDGGVELILYGAPEEPEEPGGQPPPLKITRVTAEELELIEREVAIEGDIYESVLLRENVRAILPNGAEFTSDVLLYDGGKLSTEEGARLRAGGLVVESLTLDYDPETTIARLRGEHPASQRPEMGGPAKLWSLSGGAAPAPDIGLQGSSGMIVYDVNRSLVRLVNRPEIRLPEAIVRAWEISLGLDETATSITSIDANVGARAEWLQPAAEEEYAAEGGLISVELPDGHPRGLLVLPEGEGAARPRFGLGDAGEIRADVIALGFGDGDEGSVVAEGTAFFFPAATEEGLVHIKAEELTVGAGGFDELYADGEVEILLADEAGDDVAFSGPRASVVYRDSVIAAARWPAGISYRAAGRDVSAGNGAYQPESGDWLLDGSPRPRFRSAEFDVEADELLLQANGDVRLSGAVQAQLRGDVIRTLGPLFGGATQIEAAAGTLQVRDERLTFYENARIWHADGDQLLRADEIKLLPASNELQAQGNVFVNLVDPPDEANGRDEARTVLLTGSALLVEGSPLSLVVVGDALLDLEGQGRTIGGEQLAVQLSEDGRWDSLEVTDNVVMTDPAGTGRGARLDYDADTGLVVIHAGDGVQATFIPQSGIDISDRRGLQLEWEGDDLKVTTMQNGTTQTVRGGQR